MTVELKERNSEEYVVNRQSYFKNIKDYFYSSLNLSNDVSESRKNDKINDDLRFKAFYTQAASYLQIGKIGLDEKKYKVKNDSTTEKTNPQDYFNAAQSSFQKAIEINPNDEYAWIGKGNSEFELGNYREAIQSYNFAINLNYYNPTIWYFKGLSLHNISRYEEAIDCYINSITISNLKLNDKSSDNEATTMLDAIDNYFNITLTEADIENEIGNAFYNLRLYSQALDKYDKALSLWRSTFSSIQYNKYKSTTYKKYKYLLNKVWCLVALGNGKEALKFLEDDVLEEYEYELDRFNKDNIDNELDKVPPDIKLCLIIALYLKGFIFFKNKKNDSLIYVDKAIHINQKYHLNNPYPLYLKALIYNNDKKYHEALEFLEESIELNKKFPEAYVAKAESMLLLNNKHGAAKEANKAIELAPNLGSAHSILSKLDSVSNDSGPKFLQFWKATKYRMIIAILLVVSGIVLVALPIIALYDKMNEVIFGIVAALVGLIVAVILLPDIGKVKVGNIIEFDVIQESQPGAKLELDLEKPFIPLK